MPRADARTFKKMTKLRSPGPKSILAVSHRLIVSLGMDRRARSF